MTRKRYSDEDALKVLHEIDIHLHDGLNVLSACRKAKISDKTIIIGGRNLVVWVGRNFRK